MSDQLQDALIAFAIISGFLLLGTVLRSVVPVFRKLMLPASVIGGTIGWLLGPNIWGKTAPLRFSEQLMGFWSALPGILIVPIFAAAPLGMFMGKNRGRGFGLKKTGPKILMTAGLIAIAASAQYTLGFAVNLALTAIVPGAFELYRTFGYEIGVGFAGGHGTASALGGIFQDLGIPEWQTAQEVGLTMATIGLVGGMILGIIFINIASRKGQTAISTKPGELPLTMQKGYTKNTEEQLSLGRQTMTPGSIETISVHLGILLAVSGLAYGLQGILRSWLPQVFNYIPVWFLALLLMYFFNYGLILFKLDWLIDTKIKARITGSLTDFAITAALLTVRLEPIVKLGVPILILSVLGFIVTYLISFSLHRFCFRRDYSFERGVMHWGFNTGVMITGITLLRICDPDSESPALNDFSMSFAVMSLTSLVVTPLTYYFLGSASTLVNFLWSLGSVLIYACFIVAGYLLLYKPRQTYKRKET